MRHVSSSGRHARRVPSLDDHNHRYDVKREFARGGMGRIMIALDNAVGREVALKELLPRDQHTGSATPFTPKPVADLAAERFLREARVTGRLEHPNIVPVYEVGERADGALYYTMKFVRGRTMSDRLREINEDKKLTPASRLQERLKLLDAFVDICNAIAYSHARGVIHRDLKPQNVMMGEFGETVLIDWGLAHVKGQRDDVADRIKHDVKALSLAGDDDSKLTLDGAVLGTPAYMPPEQARGEIEHVDERSDIYSLGAILYEILAGRPPYEGGNARTVLAQVLDHAPPPITDFVKDTPPELLAVVDKAMAREKDERFVSAREFAEEVQAFRDGRALKAYHYSTVQRIKRFIARNKAAVAVGAVAIALLIGGGVFAYANILEEKNEADRQRTVAEEERKESDRNAAIAKESERIAKEQEAAALKERARAEENLQKYEQAEAEKKRIKEAQDAQRKDLTDARKRAIGELETAILLLNPSARAENASARIGARAAKRGAEITGDEKAMNDIALRDLLVLIGQQESLISLLTRPIVDTPPDFIPPEKLQTEQENLLAWRTLAVRLATVNEDFALATFVLSGTGNLDESQAKELTVDIAVARAARLNRHRTAITEALDDVRAGFGRPGRPQGSPMLDDYAIQLSGYREPQTLELLSEALKPYLERLAQDAWGAQFSQSERDELTLICRVCGRLEMGKDAVAVLRPLMEQITDQSVAAECGVALCNTRHEDAYGVLMAVRDKLGTGSSAWNRIRFYLPRVPNPVFVGEPQTADQFLERANALAESGKREEAIKDYSRAIALDPANYNHFNGRGNAYRDIGEFEKALADFDEVVRLLPEDPISFNNRGLALMGLKRYDEAIADFGKAIELNTWYSLPYNNRGILYLELGRIDEAVYDFDMAIACDSSSFTSYYNRGIAKMRRNEDELAEADFSECLEINPYYANAYLSRGITYLNRGKHSQAEQDFSRCIELDPGNLAAYYNRGLTYKAKYQYRDALDNFAQVLALNPAYIDAYIMRSQTNRESYMYTEALEECEKGLAAAPDNIPLILERGAVHEAMEDREAAEAGYTRAIEIDPTNRDAWYRRAAVRSFQGDFDGAIADYGQIVTLNPDDAYAIYLRAQCYVSLKDNQKALDELDRAIKVAPYSGYYYYARGNLLNAIGDIHGALSYWRKALEVEPEMADRYSCEYYIETAEKDLRLRDVIAREPVNEEERALKAEAHAKRAYDLTQNTIPLPRDSVADDLRIARNLMNAILNNPQSDQQDMLYGAEWYTSEALKAIGCHIDALSAWQKQIARSDYPPYAYEQYTAAILAATAATQVKEHKASILGETADDGARQTAALNALTGEALDVEVKKYVDLAFTLL
ncbi:MAG: tetratricopeptide repeat protein, partial [Planctomycetes bacterium]|nr:tetratricopeptide repeat protein [Planctomycetota bacterium]